MAFASLIERGLLKPGAILTDPKGKAKAIVRPDGTVAMGDFVASIHKAGAKVNGAPTCNGWTFWHTDVDGERQVIDVLRAQVRSEFTSAGVPA